MKNNKGFSLVELIIVIAIMAVLVGVLAPTYLQYVEKSKKANDVSTVDSIINAIEIAAIDPVVVTTATAGETLKVTVKKSGTLFALDPATSEWAKAVKEAVGDAKLKSFDEVEVTATRTINGKVSFTYTGATTQDFKDYAKQITKVS